MATNYFRVMIAAFLGAVAQVANAQPAGFLVRDPEAVVQVSADLASRVAVCSLESTVKASGWTRSRYLVLDPGKPDVAIVDRIDGHSVRIVEKPMNGIRFVLGYYHAGGNQYAVSVYVFEDSQLAKLIDQPPSSNMRSIEIENQVLVVRNEENNERGERRITVSHFNMLDARKRGVR